jgi:hypothetical protein
MSHVYVFPQFHKFKENRTIDVEDLIYHPHVKIFSSPYSIANLEVGFMGPFKGRQCDNFK